MSSSQHPLWVDEGASTTEFPLVTYSFDPKGHLPWPLPSWGIMSPDNANKVSPWVKIRGSRGRAVRDPGTPAQSSAWPSCSVPPQGHPHLGVTTASQGWPLRDQGQGFGDRASLEVRTHLRSQEWNPPGREERETAATASAGDGGIGEGQGEESCGRDPGTRNRGWRSEQHPHHARSLCLLPLSPFILPAQKLGKGESQPSSGVGHGRRRVLFIQ